MQTPDTTLPKEHLASKFLALLRTRNNPPPKILRKRNNSSPMNVNVALSTNGINSTRVELSTRKKPQPTVHIFAASLDDCVAALHCSARWGPENIQYKLQSGNDPNVHPLERHQKLQNVSLIRFADNLVCGIRRYLPNEKPRPRSHNVVINDRCLHADLPVIEAFDHTVWEAVFDASTDPRFKDAACSGKRLVDETLVIELQRIALPLIYEAVITVEPTLGLQHHDVICARALGLNANHPDRKLSTRPPFFPGQEPGHYNLPENACLLDDPDESPAQWNLLHAFCFPEFTGKRMPFSPISPHTSAEKLDWYNQIPRLKMTDVTFLNTEGRSVYHSSYFRVPTEGEHAFCPTRILIHYEIRNGYGHRIGTGTVETDRYYREYHDPWEAQDLPVIMTAGATIDPIVLTHEFMRYAPELRDNADSLDRYRHNNVVQHLEFTASDYAYHYINCKSDNQVAA